MNLSADMTDMKDMIPVLEVTSMERNFPLEPWTSKKAGASSLEKCL